MGNEQYYTVDIFDMIISAILKIEKPDETKIEVIQSIIKKFEKENWKEWDKSQYFMNPLVQIALKKHQGLK